MSDPTPRSTQQILGNLVDDYLSKLDSSGIAPGIDSLKPGSSILAQFEAVAMSQNRNSQDVVNLLNSDDINKQKGNRLDRTGRAEKVLRRGETFASGQISISDSRYTKRSTSLFAGKPAPLPSSKTVFVADATLFPTSGQIYIGRGTQNYEGPLAYTAKTIVSSSYWALTLSASTANYHNTSESVILAAGGDRVINIGQVVGTPQGSASPTLFTTTSKITLVDGETSITNVPIVAQLSGNAGNVNAGAISYVQSPAFSGMTVTNPKAISNGLAIEDDDHYRERIKMAKANRSKGTSGSILSNVYGIQAPDEDASVTSAKLVSGNDSTTLYLDDGTGYEAKDSGISFETLVYAALGGEDTFTLSQHPIVPATIKALSGEPYSLSSGCTLAVTVGGTTCQHSFFASDFRNINNATAYEVVASINQDASIKFSAATFNNGSQVAIFSRAKTNEDLAIETPVEVNAAPLLTLPAGHIETLHLYKNDVLLYKDGLEAKIWTTNQSTWGGLVSGETLIVNVDGTGFRTYVISDADFIATDTGHYTVSQGNNLASWAAVINNKITGVTAKEEGGGLSLTSNRGPNAKASLVIDATSTLVVKGMFDPGYLSVSGLENDYSLNKNLGVIELVTPLSAGDSLTVGSPFTRAYIEGSIPTTITPASDAKLWVVVDGNSSIVPNTMNGLMTLTLTATATPRRLSASAASFPFTSVQVGDWVVATEPDIFTNGGTYSLTWDSGASRVSAVDPSGQWVEFEGPVASFTATDTGTAYKYISFVRTTAELQLITIPASQTYTASDIVTIINQSLVGGTASLYRNTTYRLMTNTYGVNGDISLVAKNTAADALSIYLSKISNDLSHYASVESDNSEVGTPIVFADTTVSTRSNDTTFVTSDVTTLGHVRQGTIPMLTWLGRLPGADTSHLGGNAYSTDSMFAIPVGDTTVQLQSALNPVSAGDRFIHTSGYCFGPESTLQVTLDNDAANNSVSVNMFRRLLPDPTVPYGTVMLFLDADNLDVVGNPQVLGKTFGSTFDFSNFVLYSHARTNTHTGDPTKAIHWRLNNFWNSEAGNLSYVLPTTPNSAISVSVVEPNYDVNVILASGAARSLTITNGAVVKQYLNPSDSNIAWNLPSITFLSGFTGLTLSQTLAVVTCTPTLPSSLGVTDLRLLLAVGNTIYLAGANDVNFPDGAYVLTGVNQTTMTWSAASVPSPVNNTSAGSTIRFTSAPIVDFIASGVQAYDVACGAAKYPVTIQAVSQNGIKFIDDRGNPSGNQARYVFTRTPVTFFPLTNNTADEIATAINAIATPMISARSVGSGNGKVVQTSANDILMHLDSVSPLKEGILHVASSTYSAPAQNYSLQMKYAPSDLDLDWSTEEFRLVPTTSKNVVDFLSNQSLSSLTLSGSVKATSKGDKIQLATSTLGSGGAIQVSGGSANSLHLPVQGLPTIVTQTTGNASASVTLTSAVTGKAVSVAGHAFTAVNTTPGADQWLNTGNDAAAAIALAAAINASVTSGVNGIVWAQALANTVTVTAIAAGVGGNSITLTSNDGSMVVDHSPLSGGVSTNYLRALVPADTNISAGLTQGMFVSIDASNPLNKNPLFSADAADSITISKNKLTLSGGQPAWNFCSTPSVFGQLCYFEKHGRFMAVSNAYPGGNWSVQNGDYLTVLDAPGVWSFSSSLPSGVGRYGASVVTLKNGTVMVIGGSNTLLVAEAQAGATLSTKVDIYDPASKTWSAGTDLPIPLAYSSSALLLDGRVLVCGGVTKPGGSCVVTDSSYIYDPTTLTWTSTASGLTAKRTNHTITTMSDGSVLALGGFDTGYGALNSMEVFSPNTNSWSDRTSTLPSAVANHSAVKLGNNQLLVFGAGSVVQKMTNYSGLIWTTVGPLAHNRYAPSCTILESGNILVFGGLNSNSISSAPTADVETYDVTTSTSSITSQMNINRALSGVLTLSDGRILSVGGLVSGAESSVSEIYDPNSQKWSWVSGIPASQICSRGLVENDDGTIAAFGLYDGSASAKVAMLDLTKLGLPKSNQGTFQVVAHTGDVLWVENPNAVSWATHANLLMRVRGSVMPGDVLRVSTTKLGQSNVGDFTVASVDLNNNYTIFVSGMTDCSITSMGADIASIRVLPTNADRFIMRVVKILPTSNSSQVALYLSPGHKNWTDGDMWIERISEAANSVITPMDKFNFPNDIAVGVDAYRYNTGLIAEVNKVLYGNASDPDSYPGFIAAGQNIDISPSLVRRIQISLAVRIQPGSDPTSLIKNSVAKLINTSGSKPIALSDIAGAAKVTGVISVVLLYPIPDAVHDTILVQSYETPRILDIDQDIQVSIIGA